VRNRRRRAHRRERHRRISGPAVRAMRPPIQARLLPQETHAVDVVGALHCGRKIRVPSARIMIMPGSYCFRFLWVLGNSGVDIYTPSASCNLRNNLLLGFKSYSMYHSLVHGSLRNRRRGGSN
jgi:hypothetical protein